MDRLTQPLETSLISLPSASCVFVYRRRSRNERSEAIEGHLCENLSLMLAIAMVIESYPKDHTVTTGNGLQR